MSWYRQIKIIYTICSNTLFFILWATVLNGFLGGNTDYKLYLLSLFTAFSLVAAFERTKNIKLAAAVSFVSSEVILFLLYGRTDFIMNTLYICFILFVTNINENENVNYELYKYKAKQAIFILVVMGFIFTFTKLGLQQSVLKFYIIFLITVSILMREARNYYYRIINKKSFITNLALTIGILFISLDKVFNLVVIAFTFIIDVFYKLSDEFFKLLTLVMKRPLEIMINFLGNRISQQSDLFDKVAGSQQNQQKGEEALKNLTENGWPTWLSTAVRLILLALVIYYAYKIVLKYKSRKGRKAEEIIEERVKLSKAKDNKDNILRKTIKNILRLNNLKEQAISIYKKFQIKTNDKGIFRKHMTARQLENITKTCVKNPEGIANLTKIYNEAKFSEHKITKEQVEEMRDSFGKVKKQL